MPKQTTNDRRKGLIAYYRVSTQRQGRSGLGLEAQRAKVAEYAQRTGLFTVAEYQEVRSGRKDDRPELAKALAHARRTRSVLVVAKLDRLTRSVKLFTALAESGVTFVFCDLPDVPDGPTGRMLLTMLAAYGQLEAEMIGERTRLALKAHKARGGILGASMPECRNLTPEAAQKGREAACEANRAKARRSWEDCEPIIVRLRSEGKSLRQIADALNADNWSTNANTPLTPTHIHRVLKRAES